MALKKHRSWLNGLPIRDAKTPLTLKITARDVKSGELKNPTSCAAAKCAMRLPKVLEARIQLSRGYLRTGRFWVRYKTGSTLRQEIITWDRGGKFVPGIYTLVPIPDGELLRHGKRQGSNKPGARDKNGNRTPKRKRSWHHVAGVRPGVDIQVTRAK